MLELRKNIASGITTITCFMRSDKRSHVTITSKSKLDHVDQSGFLICLASFFFFFSSRRRHTRCGRDWSSDVCSSDLSITITNVAGSAVFEITLAVIILAATGGAGLMPAFASKGHLIRSFNKLGDLLLSFGKQNKKPHAEQKATNDYEQALLDPAYVQKLQNPPKSVRSALPTPPKDMFEVKTRMTIAKHNIKQARANGQPLPTSPFTEKDKLKIVDEGLQEKYIVRLTQKRYARKGSTIGRVADNGESYYWTTTYTQIEHADSDVKQICASLGVNHDPHSTYKLLIIDNEAATASGQMTSFIPTYDKLGALAKSEMTGTNPAHIDAVMTESYSKTYAGYVAEAKAKNIDLSNTQNLNKFAAQKGLSANDKELLKTRHAINKDYGANEHFLGNGLTKNTNAPAGQTGPVETFSQDKNPQTIRQLKKDGVITVVSLN